MSDASVLQDLVEDLCAKGRITADDVLQLRRQIFPDGVVSTAEAKAVFRLDQSCGEKPAEWTRFYVDALTDYYVWQSTPRGYVSEEQAAELLAEINRDGHVDALSELELLINIVHWATKCPESLAMIALDAVRKSILTPESACFGSNRPPAIITAEDVELIRKLIYAPGSPGGFTVTRSEADLLAELDRATSAEDNAATWPDLFAKAVANALMFPRGAPEVPDAEEALRRERWLEERHGIGSLLMNIGKSVARGDVPFGEAIGEADIFGKKRESEERRQEEARVSEALAREAIDAEEASWLIGKFGGAKNLSKGVVQLLRFIRTNSPSIDPALEPLLAKAGI